MVRSRIPANALAAETDALPRTDRSAGASRDEAREDDGPFAFILEIVAPFFGRTLRSVGLGALLALGGCSADRVELEGVVRDGRTGAPIAGAHITTGDGRTLATGDDGRFALAAIEGGRVRASAEGRCDAEARVEHRRLTLELFDRLEVEEPAPHAGLGAEVRVEVRTRCDDGVAIAWRQIAGPELGPDRMRTEENGHVLIVRTHPIEPLVVLDDRAGAAALGRDYSFELEAELDGSTVHRLARVVAAPTSAEAHPVATRAELHLDADDGRLVEHLAQRGVELAAAHDQIAHDHVAHDHVAHDHVAHRRLDRSLLEHGPSASISAQARPHDERDCAGCHPSEAERWTHTAHASAFRRGLEGELGQDFDERCWSCHASRVEDGGRSDSAAGDPPDAGAWGRVPQGIGRHGSMWCSACHGSGHIASPHFDEQHGANLQVGVCARCHGVAAEHPDATSPEVDEWLLGAMSAFVGQLRGDDPALRPECARCHSAQGFVAWRRGREELSDRASVAPITCAACHDAHEPSTPAGLRVFDTADPISGAPATDLGSGALCATCHNASATDVDAAPHAPQADVLLGRGARLARALDDGAHRFIANTCVRCHMTRPQDGDPLRGLVGGHTFSIRARSGEPVLSRAACAPCHGAALAPDAIGARDWDGDGRSGSVREEHERALGAASDRLRARIASLGLRDRCASPRTAADVAEIDARLHLVDASALPLGDCDGDGRIGEGETAITVSALPRRVADAAHDLAMLSRDGSAGVHNPAYAFGVLSAIDAALR